MVLAALFRASFCKVLAGRARFVDFCEVSSKVFVDFRGFQRFCIFLHERLNASRKQLVSNDVHFS